MRIQPREHIRHPPMQYPPRSRRPRSLPPIAPRSSRHPETRPARDPARLFRLGWRSRRSRGPSPSGWARLGRRSRKRSLDHLGGQSPRPAGSGTCPLRIAGCCRRNPGVASRQRGCRGVWPSRWPPERWPGWGAVPGTGGRLRRPAPVQMKWASVHGWRRVSAGALPAGLGVCRCAQRLRRGSRKDDHDTFRTLDQHRGHGEEKCERRHAE